MFAPLIIGTVSAAILSSIFATPVRSEVILPIELPVEETAPAALPSEGIEAISVPSDEGVIIVGSGAPTQTGVVDLISTSGDWSAFRGGDPAGCWVATLPSSTKATKDGAPANVRRGDVRLTVSVLDAETVEVSWDSGYPISASAPALIRVGNADYALLPRSQTAWLETNGQSGEVLELMLAGRELEISAASQRGTQTLDTYSLNGLTDALASARAACGHEG